MHLHARSIVHSVFQTQLGLRDNLNFTVGAVAVLLHAVPSVACIRHGKRHHSCSISCNDLNTFPFRKHRPHHIRIIRYSLSRRYIQNREHILCGSTSGCIQHLLAYCFKKSARRLFLTHRAGAMGNIQSVALHIFRRPVPQHRLCPRHLAGRTFRHPNQFRTGVHPRYYFSIQSDIPETWRIPPAGDVASDPPCITFQVQSWRTNVVPDAGNSSPNDLPCRVRFRTSTS